jgi:hypothetical protein
MKKQGNGTAYYLPGRTHKLLIELNGIIDLAVSNGYGVTDEHGREHFAISQTVRDQLSGLNFILRRELADES